ARRKPAHRKCLCAAQTEGRSGLWINGCTVSHPVCNTTDSTICELRTSAVGSRHNRRSARLVGTQLIGVHTAGCRAPTSICCFSRPHKHGSFREFPA
ncbi:hypothetical protein GOODEAATRI_013882, partial [Goodea atripinnis]